MKLPEGIKGAIFDLDGTLLDSLHVWADVDRRFFERRGLPLPPDYYDAVKLLDLSAAAHYTKERFALPEPPECFVEEWLSMIREEYALHIGMKPYAKEFLLALRQKGIRLALATSASSELFLPALMRHGVKELFSAFATTGESRPKHFPDVYLLAAERLSLPPDACAVFEDVLAGIESAKRGGFYTVAVEERAERAGGALKAAADRYVTSFSELL